MAQADYLLNQKSYSGKGPSKKKELELVYSGLNDLPVVVAVCKCN